MRHVRSGSLIALTLALAAGGCPMDAEPKCGDSDAGASCEGSSSGDGKGDKATSFESDLTSGASGSKSGDDFGRLSGNGAPGAAESADSAAAAPTAPSAQMAGRSAADGSNAAERAITEADIIQVQGDKLYALSRIAGLSVIDVSDPSALRLIGRFRELPATPFEMYLKDNVALVMFTGWGQYAEADDGTVSWVSTSKLLALDVSDSANITQLGTFDVPGEISDSRIVGDVLYIVGHENGYCWRCVQDKPRTSIISLNVADPRNVEKVDELFYNEDNQSWGQRSVTVTNQRMYVAGPEYGQNEPTGSTIQVIDISDVAGDLVEGGTVTVEGQVNNRWQMDEFQGVLRVVSQPPQWWNGNGVVTTKPAIETFKVESSEKLTELGRTDITIPERDTLRSVRFDGFRGYAITA
ncbi:MAG TPA: beta-propeller domain-containing protein, partial [Polyangiales bacterium]|nr:beta-propeller domain-containing protein [Polyangiales bacterium]